MQRAGSQAEPFCVLQQTLQFFDGQPV